MNHADLILLEIGGYSADMFTMMIQEKNILRLVNIRISGNRFFICRLIRVICDQTVPAARAPCHAVRFHLIMGKRISLRKDWRSHL